MIMERDIIGERQLRSSGWKLGNIAEHSQARGDLN
jgi:hypothetical protein